MTQWRCHVAGVALPRKESPKNALHECVSTGGRRDRSCAEREAFITDHRLPPTCRIQSKRIRMTDSADALDRDDTRGFRMLFRASRDATLLRIIGRDAGGAGKSSSGGEQFVLAVPVDIDDLLVSRLLELHERNRTREPEAEYARCASPAGNSTCSNGTWRRTAAWQDSRDWNSHCSGCLLPSPGISSGARSWRGSRASAAGCTPPFEVSTAYVSRLRRRLGLAGGAALISTVRTIGYCFEADVVRK